MGIPVIDLHCDLLSYLKGDEGHSPFDAVARCSVPQLQEGDVRLQVMAIFADTVKGSTEAGLEQADLFKVMANQYFDDLELVQIAERLPNLVEGSKVGILAGFENASTFCEEDEPLHEGLERLILMFGKVGRPLYIGMTWNSENRFGGGVLSTIGLKEDGKRLLDFLSGKQIAIDFSHASDALAHDILDHISQQDLEVPILASHSNVRAVTPVGRNLPNELLQEIIQRQGVIGLNSIRAFVGSSIETFGEHIQAIVQLGGEDAISFGADFFFDGDVPKNTPGRSPDGWFFPEFDGSDRYPDLLTLFSERLGLTEPFIRKMAYQNVSDFLIRLWGVAAVESHVCVEA